MANKNVFIVGPGYIGWEVLDLLTSEGYSVTGLVRRKEHGEQIKTSGAAYLLGDLNDRDLITKETTKADIVLHTATADHAPSSQAILDGVRERAKAGQSTIYVQ